MPLTLSPRELSRRLANSPLTASDCVQLRPMAVASTCPIQQLTAADYPRPQPQPKYFFPLTTAHLSKADKLASGVGGLRPKDARGAPARQRGGCPCGCGAIAPLPCLRINNSNGGVPTAPQTAAMPTAAVLKAEFIVKQNLLAMLGRYGLEQIGFLTLTFADDVQDHKEASKRFNSLSTGVLNERYVEWIRVSERQKSGRWHFHLVVVCRHDVRRGIDFAAIARRDYQTANPALRSEWAFWRKTAKRYGFGRTELLPVKKTGKALAHYVAKYISKGFAYRRPEDKGMRLVGYSRKARVVGSRFSFYSLKSFLWRQKAAAWAASVYQSYRHTALAGGHVPVAPFTSEDMPTLFGKRWAWRCRDDIMRANPVIPFHLVSGFLASGSSATG